MEPHVPSSSYHRFSYDLELPIDCDDEYWPADDNSGGFRQPLGKPSKLTVFILMIKLYHIQVDMIRAIVSTLRHSPGC